MQKKHLFIIAGESSGDTRASEVMHELTKIDPSLTFEGLGGTHMKKAGAHILFDLPAVAVVGFCDVIKKYFFFRKIFYMALNRIKEVRPRAVIFVDYPGFNLRLARKVKALGITTIYYVSPQVWAWAPWRVKKIAQIIDKMLAILPFEVDFYKERTSLNVEFVGHPLSEAFSPSDTKENIKRELSIENKNPIVAILAGSRLHEVRRILPTLLKAGLALGNSHPNVHFLISKAPHLDESLYKNFLNKTHIPATLTERNIHDLIAAADFCWVTSGTATLETALGLRPHIITYKTSPFTYFLAKRLVTIPFIGLANIIAGRKIIPEFIQKDAHPETIAHETKFILSNEKAHRIFIENLREVKEKLGPADGAARAAAAIYSFLH